MLSNSQVTARKPTLSNGALSISPNLILASVLHTRSGALTSAVLLHGQLMNNDVLMP